MKYLHQIKSPHDLKALPEAVLDELAEEIREFLIKTVSQNGGHLASNLGVVELSIALHRVFDSPCDQIVWDVGHQCYTHKLLTGRYDGFSSLRQAGGISGFTRPGESEHDVFFSGHSSTSVSASLGLAAAKRIAGDKGFVVAVVGDGSFTGGMIYEALNCGGRSNNRQIVILNDNQMSISENVGALSKQLAVMRTKPGYFFLKETTERAINKIPLVGESLSAQIFKLKTEIKNKLYDKSTFFEDLGYRYMGPIDGHNIQQLCQALEGAKHINGPVLLHISTIKGKGYDKAEKAPSLYHGIGSFDIVSGETKLSQPGYSDVFGTFMCRAAEDNKKLCALTAAMSIGTGLSDFERKYPGRFFDVGIAEEHAVTMTGGLAKNGMIPVFAVYSTFLQRGYDQLIHDISLQNSHAVFAVDRAGFVGQDGETHQGIFDVAFFNTIPNFKVYSPCTFAQLESVLDIAVNECDSPVAVRYPRASEHTLSFDVDNRADYFVYGDADADTVVVTYGRLCDNADKAVAQLRREGLKVKLIGLNLIKPIPYGAIEEALKAQSVFFFEEGIRSGGVGSLMALVLVENGYKGDFSLTAVNDCFVPQAPIPQLMKEYHLDTNSIIKTVRGELNG